MLQQPSTHSKEVLKPTGYPQHTRTESNRTKPRIYCTGLSTLLGYPTDRSELAKRDIRSSQTEYGSCHAHPSYSLSYKKAPAVFIQVPPCQTKAPLLCKFMLFLVKQERLLIQVIPCQTRTPLLCSYKLFLVEKRRLC